MRGFLVALMVLACSGNLACGQQKKIEGWANVPGGTVWLEPGRHAYEHDTGLVRDLVTGAKSRPITPQSLAVQPQPYAQPFNQCCPVPAAPLAPAPYYAPVNPYYAPYAPYVNPYVNAPVPPTFAPPRYDLGPNNVYGRNVGGYGAKLGSPGSINSRWPTGRLPK